MNEISKPGVLHRGGGTIETWQECADMVIANLLEYHRGAPLPTPVSVTQARVPSA